MSNCGSVHALPPSHFVIAPRMHRGGVSPRLSFDSLPACRPTFFMRGEGPAPEIRESSRKTRNSIWWGNIEGRKQKRSVRWSRGSERREDSQAEGGAERKLKDERMKEKQRSNFFSFLFLLSHGLFSLHIIVFLYSSFHFPHFFFLLPLRSFFLRGESVKGNIPLHGIQPHSYLTLLFTFVYI